MTSATEASSDSTELLIDAIQRLALATTLDEVVEIVRVTARRLTGADGATFVLRDGDQCYYVDESAVSPLWSRSCSARNSLSRRSKVNSSNSFRLRPRRSSRSCAAASWAETPLIPCRPASTDSRCWFARIRRFKPIFSTC